MRRFHRIKQYHKEQWSPAAPVAVKLSSLLISCFSWRSGSCSAACAWKYLRQKDVMAKHRHQHGHQHVEAQL